MAGIVKSIENITLFLMIHGFLTDRYKAGRPKKKKVEINKDGFNATVITVAMIGDRIITSRSRRDGACFFCFMQVLMSLYPLNCPWFQF